MSATSIKFCTHGGGTNWGVPNNLAATGASILDPRTDGAETDIFISSDSVPFIGNPFIEGRDNSWGNRWLGLKNHPSTTSWAELQKLKYNLQIVNGTQRSYLHTGVRFCCVINHTALATEVFCRQLTLL